MTVKPGKHSSQNYLVGLLLTMCYAVAGSQVYSLGFYQTAWVNEGLINATEGSIVSSVSFCVDLLSNPIFQLLIIRFRLNPYVTLSISAPLLSIGLIGCSFSSTFPFLILFNGFIIAPSISIAVVSCYTALFQFFRDDQLDLFSSAILSGTGFGVLPVCVLFSVFDHSQWPIVFRIQLIFPAILLTTAFVLSPKGRYLFGIRAVSQFGEIEPQENEDTVYLFKVELETDKKPKNEIADPVCESTNDYQPISEHNLKVIISDLATNVPFLLTFISFGLGGCGFDGLMTHQPARLSHFGYKSGPASLAGNGCIQVIVRLMVGVVASRNILSPIRMSQLSKISLFTSTLFSNYWTGKVYQSFFYFFIGIGGGVINVADFLLIKECVSSGRDLAATFFMLINGLLNLPVIILMGALYEDTGSYVLSYNIVAVLLLVSLLFSVFYNFVQLRDSRRIYVQVQ